VEAGAWPFLVGGVICLLKCDNERDLDLLNRGANRGAVRYVWACLGIFGCLRLVVSEFSS
jgi:hypothetical protein